MNANALFPPFVSEKIVKYLNQNGITSPSDIQMAVMQTIFEKNDVIGISKTGTGKTLAYLLPVIANIDVTIKMPQVVILTPTHELAHQVCKVANGLLTALDPSYSAALIIGGASIDRQIEALKKKPKIIVGSFGRILELNKIKKLTMHYVKTIIIDEADRMLDLQNFDQLKQIIKTTQKDRNLLFFSATMGDLAEKSALEISNNPITVTSSDKNVFPETISHLVFISEQRDKVDVLRKIIHGEKIDKALLFVNRQNDIENTVKRLNFHQVTATSLSGGSDKFARKQVLSDFKNGKTRALVASDLAARGLDISGLTHIVSLEPPENPTFYLHRAGRTGRMGKNGVSIVICSEHELKFITNIEKKLNIKFNRVQMRFGEICEQ